MFEQTQQQNADVQMSPLYKRHGNLYNKMRRNHAKPDQKGDAVAILLVGLLAAALLVRFFPRQGEGDVVAEIYKDGILIQTLSLAEAQELTVTGAYHNTITVQNGKIAVTDTDCPGADCAASGWIGTAGRSIVCLPNGLEIRIVADAGGVDFVVG